MKGERPLGAGTENQTTTALLEDRWSALCTVSGKQAIEIFGRRARELPAPGPGSAIIGQIMDAPREFSIPNRAETLQVLRLMGEHLPILMLSGAADGFGARWSLDGHPVQPAIASWLMQEGFIADTGATELGVRKLALTADGIEFRRKGLIWWSGLGRLARLRVVIFG